MSRSCHSRTLATQAKARRLPSHVRELYQRGQECDARSDLEGALREWEASLALMTTDEENPDHDPDLLLSLGQLHGRLNRHELCIQYTRRCIAVNPSQALAHLNLGSALSNRGHHADAIECFERCLDLNPDKGLERLACANIGFTLHHFPDRHDEALKRLRRSLELTPAGRESESLTKTVRRTINEIEAEMANKAAGIASKESTRVMRGEFCSVVRDVPSWDGFDLCGGCGVAPTGRAKTLQLCAGCHLISFCSPECQAIAWKEGHKRVCRGKTGRLPTPAQLRTASPAALLSMLKQHQAGHANFAFEGLKCFLAYMRKDITKLDADHLTRINESVGEIVCSHPQHIPIQQIGTALGARLTLGARHKALHCALSTARCRT